MRKLLFSTLNDSLAICITLVLCLPAVRQSNSETTSANQKGAAMSGRATGTFDVNLVPQDPPDKADGSTLTRMTIDKQFHGELEATAKGQMLTAITDVKGSAAYVAIERISGTLNGRAGTFVLQ